MSDIDVSRFKFFNGGSLWTVTFPTYSGDVSSLYINSSGLDGTGLLASVAEDIQGSALGGSFRLYATGGFSSGFPLDVDGTFLWMGSSANNGSRRSEPLAWNADADDVRIAIEDLLPDSASQGDVDRQNEICKAGTDVVGPGLSRGVSVVYTCVEIRTLNFDVRGFSLLRVRRIIRCIIRQKCRTE